MHHHYHQEDSQRPNNTSRIHDPENPVLHYMTTLIIMSNGDIRSTLDRPSPVS